MSDGYISPIGEYSQNSGQRDHAKAIHEHNLKGTIPRDAIDASNLTVSGNLYLRKEPELERFRSFGRVGFFGLETRGAVILTGASLRAPYPQTFALILAGGKIGGDLISDFPGQLNDPQLRIWGGASFAELIVGRGVQLCGTFTNLDAPGLSVARDTTLSIRVESFLNLSGADLKGDLNLYGFHFFSFDPKTKPQFGFSMRAADVGHAIFLSQFIDTSYVSFKRCKRYKPLCYPQHELFQVETPMGWASILQKSGSPPLLLDGRSDPLHELNASGAVYLESDEAVADYIRFFGSYVWGEEGPFVIVEEKLQLPKDAVAKGICSVSAMVVSNEPSDIDLDQMRRLLAEDSHAVLDDQVWSNLKEQLRLHGRTARSNVRYGAYLSTATLFLLTAPIEEPLFGSQKRGMMFMLSDETIAEFKADKLPVYDRFLTRNQPQPDYPYQDLHPEDFSEVELTLRIPQWKRMLELKVAGFQNASVDLTNASCRTLEDADGLAWGTELSQIELENFRYASLGSSLMQTQTTTLGFTAKVLLLFLGRKDRIPQRCLTLPRLFVQRKRRSSKDRIDWLRRMPHQGNVFRPQPYAHLASVLNSSGDYVVANRVEEERINLEVRHESIRLRSKAPLFLTYLFYRPLWAVFHVAYRYGLSPARATAVLFLCLLGGWKGVDVLNQHDLLVQNTSSVSTLVTKDKNKLVTAFPLPANGQKYESQDLLCGTSINEFLYAADVFIPLLDLRQEGRCDVRSVREGEIRPIQEWKIQAKTGHKITHFLWALFHDGVLWAQLLKSAYAVLGWVVISLTILTYSGTLRRWGEK